jgi:His-Xaa-Ser system protein HxsD
VADHFSFAERSAMSIDVVVDVSVYPVEAVMAAAYVFIDRCYVLLDKQGDGRIRVELAAKGGTGEEELRDLAGELRNELLAQSLRRHVAARHQRVRETIIARALFGAAPVLAPEAAAVDPSFVPAAEDDYLDDPLGIAVPWEEKYGKEPEEGAQGGGGAGGAPERG